MELKALHRIEELPAADWNRLDGADNPFLRYEFLAALERHQAVGRETGWHPYHLGLFDDDRLVAVAPAYLKTNSWGEFVFDFAWAHAYARHGLDYYPKLVMAVPFTPATGPRLLTDPRYPRAALERAVAEGARQMTDESALSSAHWLFPSPEHAQEIETAGYAKRYGCQYHWRNPGYTDFEDFLAALSSKKRKNIRRERRRVEEADVRCRIVHGSDADDMLWRYLHRFYRRTFYAHGNPPVLSRELFCEIGRTLGDRIVLVVAERGATPIAGAVCLRSDTTLYGRYWGCDEEVEGLHFETCYYQGIDYCIREGLRCFEPGAQGEHKVARGFLPTLTRSYHYLADARFRAAVDDFLARERVAVEDYARTLTQEGPYREDALQRIADC